METNNHHTLLHLHPETASLFALYYELERQTAAFRAAAGISCPDGCGSCCDTPSTNIEASVFELVPFALDRWMSGEAEHTLELAGLSMDSDACLLYMRSGPPGQGRCGAYALRPLVCRLFGFSAIKDKESKLRYSLCKTMKQPNPAMAHVVSTAVDQGMSAPVFSEYSMRLYSISPSSLSKRYPVNTAIRLALEHVLFRASLGAYDSLKQP